METLLITIFTTLFVATLLNILFHQFNISHILGYIFTGVIISYLFDFNTEKIEALDLVAEFGVVFLMFTIGLELNFEKIKKMKEILLINGALQMIVSTLLFFIVSAFIFGLNLPTSLIISLAFSLSSTAIVLPYLQESKDNITPYGKKSIAILIFQDLAVIPILLLLTFLSYGEDISIWNVLAKTIIALVFIAIFIHYIGDKMVKILLYFAAKTRLEEIFFGTILAIVLGMAVLTHAIGFTYSLGAFIAGVLIADTKYSMKVESDIVSYKDLLLSIFFFSIGTKIDIASLYSHFFEIFGLFVGVMVIKTVVIYWIIRRKSDINSSIKTAIALSQIGGIAYVIFDMATRYQLMPTDMAQFLILIIFMTMIVTPFMLNNIYKISSYFEKEFYESDVITPINKKNHIIIVGFGTLGRAVAKELLSKKIDFIVISDNLQHVLLARRIGIMAYFGHLNKRSVMESLKVEESKSVIVTVQSEHKKSLIAQAVNDYYAQANIVIKVDSDEEKLALETIKKIKLIDSNESLSSLLVEQSLKNRV